MFILRNCIIFGSILLSGVSYGLKAVAEASCLPSENGYEQLAEYQSEDGKYSYYFAKQGENYISPYIAFEDEDICEIILGSENYDMTTQAFLDEYLPEEIATGLYIDLYSRLVDQVGGLDAYQEAVDDSENLEDPPFRLVSPALENSLEEIGIELPDTSLRISSDLRSNLLYQRLTQLQSPLFNVSSVEEIRYVDNYFLMGYELDDENGVVFGSLSEEDEIEVFYLGSKEEYNPEMISFEHQIPLRVFEEFEE